MTLTEIILADAVSFNEWRGADEIIAADPSQFASIETAPCKQNSAGGVETCDEPSAEFHSCYARDRDGLAHCFGDFADRAACQRYAAETARRFGLALKG